MRIRPGLRIIWVSSLFVPPMPSSATAHSDLRQSFTELLDRHRGIVVKVAASYCRHPDDRSELAQEIAAQLWRAFPSYDASRSFSTWAYRIALNVAISDLRGRTHRQPTLPLGEQPDIADPHATDPERERQVRSLYAFIAQLKPLDRALMLLYLDERPHREVAEILGISESNVSTKIGRLKQRIRDEL
uniref:RNA polymerase ECF-type sigma factor n=1 Tax=Stigmatella aurantiaca TaxID=41 RepID=A0A7U3MW11_STIAU|nr:RNA polymerase ECF-type sigma factor [Stigmatella aurantiaca]